MMKKLALASVLLVPLIGCTIAGSDYEEPQVTVPTRFFDGSSTELNEAARIAWWRALGDPVLDEIIAVGLGKNLDIRIALERINAAAAGTRRTGINAQIDGEISGDLRRSRATNGAITEDDAGSVNAAFVFDLFGGIRRGREESLARLDAARLDVGTVRLAYLADVVGSYVMARYYQNAAWITRQSIASWRETLNLVQRRFGVQEATSLEDAQARSLLATAQASLPGLEANYQANVFRIATLINQPASAVMSRMNRGGAQPRPRGALEVGIPADLLRNRPDVRTAERNFAAAIASIGVAEAQLYPSIELLGNVTAGNGRSWAFGPSITIPLLNLPVRIANRDIARSRAREAELVYRQEVLRAIEETQSALAFTRFQRRQAGSYGAATSAAREVVDLSRASYESGGATLIEILDAERTLLSNRLELARATRDWASSWVQLQVSVGKGWLAGVQSVRVASN